jgi:hypothetical protein
MADKSRNSDEHASSLKLGFASLLAGAFAAYAITQSWLEGTPYQLLLWIVGGLTFGFGLARLFPAVFRTLFQGLGYMASFTAMMFVVLFSLGKDLPTFNGTVNTGSLNGQLSETARDMDALANRSKESMEEAVAYIREAVDK